MECSSGKGGEAVVLSGGCGGVVIGCMLVFGSCNVLQSGGHCWFLHILHMVYAGIVCVSSVGGSVFEYDLWFCCCCCFLLSCCLVTMILGLGLRSVAGGFCMFELV